MTWREIKKSGEVERYISEIWAYESRLPKWYQAARKVWTATEESFAEFVMSCWEVHGWFDGDKLLALIYFERASETNLLIHLSVIHPIDLDRFASACAELRDRQFSRGFKTIRGWVLRKNRTLMRMLYGIGFRELGLRTDRGVDRGRVFRWELLEAAAG